MKNSLLRPIQYEGESLSPFMLEEEEKPKVGKEKKIQKSKKSAEKRLEKKKSSKKLPKKEE
jgi:hypothetical protein